MSSSSLDFHKNGLAKCWVQCSFLYHIYFWYFEDFLKAVLHREKMKNSHRAVKFDQKINIAYQFFLLKHKL